MRLWIIAFAAVPFLCVAASAQSLHEPGVKPGAGTQAQPHVPGAAGPSTGNAPTSLSSVRLGSAATPHTAKSDLEEARAHARRGQNGAFLGASDAPIVGAPSNRATGVMPAPPPQGERRIRQIPAPPFIQTVRINPDGTEACYPRSASECVPDVVTCLVGKGLNQRSNTRPLRYFVVRDSSGRPVIARYEDTPVGPDEDGSAGECAIDLAQCMSGC